MNDFKITPIERGGQRVLTTAQLAEAYGTDSKVISYNFNHNKAHYTEGKHFYRLTGKELREFFENVNFTNANLSKIRTLYL
ncbi:MAG: ORF6N domain-containing protein [Ruminococcus sp.]|nr:ORF6N domain-containing protein [Ruminococcus sp.]